jgi:two-component system, NtrC family, sensor kinase
MYKNSCDIFDKFMDCLTYLNLTKKEIEKIDENFREIKEKFLITEKLATVGQLGAGVAHEINNPLGIILMNVQVVARKLNSDSLEASDIPPCLINLNRIEKAALRCRNIVENLLTFSGKFNLKYSLIRLNTIIDEVIDEVCEIEKDYISTQKVEFIKEFHNFIPTFMGDSYKLKQVFSNLFLNAFEAIKRKGSNGDDSWIKVRSSSTYDCIRASISDNGCGIAEENLIRLFDPFFSTKEQGTGLGLAVSYGIIESHDGLIEVESVEGVGSTFTIILPLAKKAG